MTEAGERKWQALGHFDQSCTFADVYLEPRAQRLLYPPRQRQ